MNTYKSQFRLGLICIVVASVVGLVSECTSKKEEQAIADYVQTNGNVKTNMSFDMVSLDFIADMYGRDSLDILMKEYQKDYNTPVTAKSLLTIYKQSIPSTGDVLREYRYKIDSVAKIEDDPNRTNADKALSNAAHMSYLKMVDFLSTMHIKDSIQNRMLTRYSADSAKVISKKYKAVYTIKNPALNNAEQEITNIFYLSPAGDKVYAKE